MAADPPPRPKSLQHLRSESFHALLIGIDQYSEGLTPLSGSVRDMENMKAFLLDAFDIPQGSTLDIRELKNKSATHDSIIAEIRKLQNDESIKMNDAILIYYAGHGATVPPPEGWSGYCVNAPADGWPEHAEIQCIVASDAVLSKDNRGYFISSVVLDRTLAALLHDLADKKGTNITVILDCCHSGSGTRGGSDNIRGIEFKDPDGRLATVPGNYDRRIWDKFIDSRRGAVIDGKYRHAGLASHVLLGACGSKEKAADGYSFTQALLKYLRQESVSLNALSYATLIKSINLHRFLNNQHPICEGNGKNSILFDLKEINVGRPTFDVVKQSNNSLVLCGGSMHGIVPDLEFAVYTSKVFSISDTLLGTCTVDSVNATTSSLKCTSPDTLAALITHDFAVASPTTYSEDKFSVYATPGESFVHCVEDAIGQEHEEDRYGRPQLRLAKLADEADLILQPSGKNIACCYPPHSQVVQLGLDRLHFTPPADSSDIRRVLRSASHFFKFLNHGPPTQTTSLQKGLAEIRLCELEVDTDAYEIVAGELRYKMYSKPSFKVHDGEACEVKAITSRDPISDAPGYGIEIVNKHRFPLYAWVLFFDCSTLEIRSYYEPPVTYGSDVVDPTLPAYTPGTEPLPVALNFKNGGGDILKFQLYDGQSLDVAFLKIFLFTRYLGGDLSCIAQSPASMHFNGLPRSVYRKSRPFSEGQSHFLTKHHVDIWDVVTIPLVQRPIRDQ